MIQFENEVKLPARNGTRFLYALQPGERWRVHPTGHGIIVVHPEKQPMWVREDCGQIISSRISLP